MRGLIPSIALICAVLPATSAHAHGGTHEAAGLSVVESWVVVTLALTVAVYALGFHRLRQRSRERIATGTAGWSFAAGIAVLFIMLSSPVDRMSDALFSAHMVQHLVLMLVVAPLLVVGRMAMVFLWALPAGFRQSSGSWWAQSGLSRMARPLFSHPIAIWIWFCGTFVFWHLPGPYDAALRSEPVHILEHLVFVVSAFGFWSVVIEPLGRRRLGYGESLLFVATAAIVSGLPGALMILAARPLYGGHADGVAQWGLTLMQDQQLGGVIMWVPAGFAYLAAVSILFVRWLHEAERRSQRRSQSVASLALFGLILLLNGCDEPAGAAASMGFGDPKQGAREITEIGCGSCHIIPGIERADGLVGPPLDHMGRRTSSPGCYATRPTIWWPGCAPRSRSCPATPCRIWD